VSIALSRPFTFGRPPAGKIDELTEAEATPSNFLENYVNRKEPVVIRGAGAAWPAASLWQHRSHLTEKYGRFTMTLENKHEHDGGDKRKASLSDFLDNHLEDSYIVSELPEPMFVDVDVPRGLRCGQCHLSQISSTF
jgi:hypothetical protein